MAPTLSPPPAHETRRRYFGTSGIRGQVDGLLTPEFAARIGLAFAAMLENKGTVLVGRDVRLHSQSIQNAMMSGLAAGGVNGLDCGLVPTPALLFALRKLRHDAAIMVTGSHTPAPIGGILFFQRDTGEMDRRGEEQLEGILLEERWRRLPWNKMGSINTLDVTNTYLEEIQRHLPHVSGYRVVVDPGNGSACLTLGCALENLGCEVIAINKEPDGHFPSRSPNPEPSSLGQLASAVMNAKADLGVGTDSDGDRAIFVSGKGQVLWGDLTGALFVKHELKRHTGGHVITTVNTSDLIGLLCKEYGGRLTVTKVGPPAIAEALRWNPNSIIAVEESGKYIWPEVLWYGDAAIATDKLLEIMNTEHKTLDELQSGLPKRHQVKCAVPCLDELKTMVLQRALDEWKGRTDVEISTIDGVRMNFSNGSWVLLRASGTEPVLRCYSESENLEEAEEHLHKMTKEVQDHLLNVKEAGNR